MADAVSDEHLTKVDGRDVWFISARGKGFTCWADFALKSPQGYPVAAPAEGLIAARHVLKHKAALWEHILDAMEECYSIEEGADATRANDRRDTLIEAMAILNHGVADETSIALTEAEAMKRYKLSSE